MVVGKGQKCANNVTYYLNVPIMRNLKQGILFKDLFYRIVSRETKKCHKNYLDGRLDVSLILHRPKKGFSSSLSCGKSWRYFDWADIFFSSKQFRFKTTNEYFFWTRFRFVLIFVFVSICFDPNCQKSELTVYLKIGGGSESLLLSPLFWWRSGNA